MHVTYNEGNMHVQCMQIITRQMLKCIDSRYLKKYIHIMICCCFVFFSTQPPSRTLEWGNARVRISNQALFPCSV